MRIAVIGAGGREHAILWRLSRDAEAHELFALPGNGGTGRMAQSIPVDIQHIPTLVDAISGLSPDLVVVGPEMPLALGISDALSRTGIRCFGPCAHAAQLEASKVFAKRLMQQHGIPTSDFRVFSDYSSLETFVTTTPFEPGWVVKADGLAAGKGAFVCTSLAETLCIASALLRDYILGKAGQTVVLERRLLGREVSALYFCDGVNSLPLPPAQDYKRSNDNDSGPNTGGMGSFCPADHLTPKMQQQIETLIVARVLSALSNAGAPYRGILYVGLMLTDSGPQVIEFNCRFGDPETQVILPVWKGSFAETMLSCVEGRLNPQASSEINGSACCVVLAAEGYPDHYEKSLPLIEIPDTDYTVTFHAGTIRNEQGLFSSGGRVLNAVGLAPTLEQARVYAYELADKLRTRGLRFRSDIARSTLT